MASPILLNGAILSHVAGVNVQVNAWEKTQLQRLYSFLASIRSNGGHLGFLRHCQLRAALSQAARENYQKKKILMSLLARHFMVDIHSKWLF